MSARWGQPHRDTRDWPTYNESLVVRGEFYLDLTPLRNWDQELAVMNRGKRGGQYQIPDSFVRWLVIWKQWIDYRGLEGIGRQLVDLKLIPTAPDYTTLWHRLHALTPAVRLPRFTDLELASDGTGLKTTNAGEHRILRYGDPDAHRRRHLVVVLTADVRRKKVIGIEVHIEGKGHSESDTAMRHVKEVARQGYRIRRFYGDGAYDSRRVFNALHDIGAESAVKIARNAQPSRRHSGGPGGRFRRREVRDYRALGYERWAKVREYGMRWPGTEGMFSAVKRKFGENTVARSATGLVAEGYQRFWAYDELRQYGEDGGAQTRRRGP